MANILIADDHAVARRGLKEIIRDGFPTASITMVTDAEELFTHALKFAFDIAITDINMPGRSGLEVLADLSRNYPKLPVLIISFYPEEEYAVRSLKAGAAGFLNKEKAEADEIVKAVNIVLSGKKYITPSIAELLAEEVSIMHNKKPHEILSDREFQVFTLLAKGLSTGSIAEKLSLSVNTISTFRSRILAKMNMKSNAEIVAYAIKNNLI